MNEQHIKVLLAAAIAIALIWTGWAGLVFLAFLATGLTMGLRTGTWAPMCPEVSRSDHPVAFWLFTLFGALMVVGTLISLIMHL